MLTNYHPANTLDPWEAENVFYLKAPPARLAKLIAHYELYKRIVGIPGEVIECGVYKGASLMRWAHFRDLLEPQHARKIRGFDAFGAFPREKLETSQDIQFAETYDDGGGMGIAKDALLDLLAAKGFTNIDLYQGNVFDTVPTFIEQHRELKIALLHLDMDVHAPTAKALELLGPHMVRGGLIVIDDYATVEGATRAVDAYCQTHGLKVEKLSFNYIPAFIVC